MAVESEVEEGEMAHKHAQKAWQMPVAERVKGYQLSDDIVFSECGKSS